MGLFDNNPTLPSGILPLKGFMPPDAFLDDGTTEKLVSIYESAYAQFIRDIKNFPNILSPDLADEKFIDLLFKHLGFDLNINLGLVRKRKLLKVIVQAYKQKGTAPGIENVIRQFIGVDATVFPFTYGWVLNQSELSYDTYLNPAPTNRAGFYTFDIIVATKLSAEQQRVVRELVKLMKPAHMHFRNLQQAESDAFLDAGRVLLNRGSLYLKNNQNTDGGWDETDSDADPGTFSNRRFVEAPGLGCFHSFINTSLPTVEVAARKAVQFLVDNATYSMVGSLPEPGDIELLHRGDATYSIAGAGLKRDDALFNLREFFKAIAFLNNPLSSVAAIAATTQQERDTTSLDKRASFAFLYMTASYGVGAGIILYCHYVRDFLSISDDASVTIYAKQLFSRLTSVNLATDLGQQTIGACASIVWVLQKGNLGAFEARIQDAIATIEARYVPAQKLYYDTSLGSGRIYEQALVLDAFMVRGKFDSAKTLITGLRSAQRVNGSFEDPIEPGTSRLLGIGRAMEFASKALKRIDEEGL